MNLLHGSGLPRWQPGESGDDSSLRERGFPLGAILTGYNPVLREGCAKQSRVYRRGNPQ